MVHSLPSKRLGHLLPHDQYDIHLSRHKISFVKNNKLVPGLDHMLIPFSCANLDAGVQIQAIRQAVRPQLSTDILEQ